MRVLSRTLYGPGHLCGVSTHGIELQLWVRFRVDMWVVPIQVGVEAIVKGSRVMGLQG